MKAVIMAGGLGTRISSVNSEIPKPMLPIAGKPVLEHQIICLREQGIRELILVVGYKHEVIQDHFGNGTGFGVQIRYIVEDTPLGTAGALYFLQDEMNGEEAFLLLNGDIIFDVDFARFAERHRSAGGLATILIHPNDHPYDSTLVETGPQGRVTGWGKSIQGGWYRNRVNAGIHLLSAEIFPWMREHDMLTEVKKRNLDRDVLWPLMKEGRLYAYESPEYVKDMGTPERYLSVERDIRSGRVKSRNLSCKQRAVFLDRDGTLNEYVGFLREPSQLRLLDGVGEAVRRLNEDGWLVIVVTNQPVIARGEVTTDGLEEIHRKLETLLGQGKAYVDRIYYCPHHPEKGYEGERPEYKIVCDCRKPKPGMLFQAAQDYNIDLSVSWMVGDSQADMLAGEAAGCHTAGVYGCEGKDGTFRDLPSFVKSLCGTEAMALENK